MEDILSKRTSCRFSKGVLALYRELALAPTYPAQGTSARERYIKLHPHLTCESQGILDLDGTECGYASQVFGFKYTGARSFQTAPGCWGLTSGAYAGNANLNANATGTGVPDGIVAMCPRN